MKKIKILILLLVFALGTVVILNYSRLNIITGFSAKSVCSCTFEADRSLSSIEAEDNAFSPVNLAKSTINFEQKSVSSTVFWFEKTNSSI